MGYRSCIAYKIVFYDKVDRESSADTKPIAGEDKWKDLFYVFLTEAKVNRLTCHCFSPENDWGKFEVIEEEKTIRYYVDNMKWYTDYEEVVCHEELIKLAKFYAEEFALTIDIKELEGSEKTTRSYTAYPLGGTFIRIGESVDDNEEDEFGAGLAEPIYITRSIEKDW